MKSIFLQRIGLCNESKLDSLNVFNQQPKGIFMKNMKGCFVACVAFALMQTSASAAVAITKSNINFSPVKWRLTQNNGQYSILNSTTQSQFVLVTLEKGSVGTFTTSADGKRHVDYCGSTMSDTTYYNSMVCELKPDFTLNIDKDFADKRDAKGTIQIEMPRKTV